MDILFVVPYVPSMVRTRPYNLIRHLARGNRITLLTVWTDEAEKAQLAEMQEICHAVQALPLPVWRSLWNSLRALPGRKPLQSVYSYLPALVSSFNGNSRFDVVHVEHLRGSRYGLYLKQHTKLPVVWDSVDCITHLFRQAADRSSNLVGRLRSWLDLERTARYEGWLLGQFNHVVVTSPLDKKALLDLAPEHVQPGLVSVVGNGVDIDYFRPNPTVNRESATLVISGKMSYHANVSMTTHLVQNILPHVWSQRPDVKLLIVGKDPVREIQQFAADPRITVTGTVPDFPPYLQKATIAVAPITYGAGIQNKVLEAMACGTPVVTTPQAVSALEIVPGQDAVVAAEPEMMGRKIVDLLADPGRQARLGENGRAYVESRHHWPNVAARFESIYQQSL
jgi:glycosyltransferase involved in cell wall biosynthesis